MTQQTHKTPEKMTNNSTTDTPRTDACPHCGAEELEGGIMKCHSYAKNHTNAGFRSMLCREREKSQKLEAEVERLRADLRRAIEIAEGMWASKSPLRKTRNQKQNRQMTTIHTELLVPKIRSLIADKEMVTAQANLDIARGGEWRTDYAAWHGHLDVEIQSLLDQASSNHNEMKDEIEQLNIDGATAVEAAKIFKQRAEKAEAEVERLRWQLMEAKDMMDCQLGCILI